MNPRPVRPGEVPRPFSVWRWRSDAGLTSPFLVLGLEKRKSSWGQSMYLVALALGTHQIERGMAWTGPSSGVGVGPVLMRWECVDEGPAE